MLLGVLQGGHSFPSLARPQQVTVADCHPHVLPVQEALTFLVASSDVCLVELLPVAHTNPTLNISISLELGQGKLALAQLRAVRVLVCILGQWMLGCGVWERHTRDIHRHKDTLEV